MSVSELEQKMAGELGRAMSLLESRGVPHERARSVDNGILVLDQRYSREVFDLNARIRELEAALLDIENHPNAIFNVAVCEPGAPTIRDLVRAVLPPAETVGK